MQTVSLFPVNMY